MNVLSYGGGLQTVGMVLLVGRGVLPRPDRIVMADTGREVRSTFDYLDRYVRPYLAEHGLAVEVASHQRATVDLYAANGDLLLPAFTATGKLPTFCSVEWKQRVVERHLRGSGVTGATSWIGFSFDERRRIKGDGGGPWRRSYPLVDLMVTRPDLEALIGRQGWPLPPKSRCWMCPHQTNAEWRELRDTAPEEFALAVAVDEEVRAADERGAVYLHGSRRPLAEADLDAPDRREPVRQCGLGTCWL
jgi:hypothetical protein